MRLSIACSRPCSLVRAGHMRAVSCRVKERATARPTSLELELTGLDLDKEFPHAKLGKKWTEYQGSRNWEGLLDPLDLDLKNEILRYGGFVQATYNAFNFDPSSSSYAMCKFSKHSMLRQSGLPKTGYRLTRNLQATSGIWLPKLADRVPGWITKRSSWIGYVAVCEDEKEIARLGRRDVVIAYRGTATCMEWLENLRGMLTPLPYSASGGPDSAPMVESGFWSLYTSRDARCQSLSEEIRQEVGMLLETYRDQPLSITVTGHSLGAALAVLTAYDITTTFHQAPLVTVISFGGPRVGNRSFGCQVERHGSKVLRIVNTNDVVTKLPPIILHDDVAEVEDCKGSSMPNWLIKGLERSPWAYADVGRELRVSSKDCPYLNRHINNVAKCHELDVYLHLVNGFFSSTCPFRVTSKPDLFGLFATQATLATRESNRIR